MTARPNQRDRILDATLRLMSAQGAAKTSMRQLASECGLNVAAIYHYFPSKEALLAAVVEERRYGSRLADFPAIDPELSPIERIRAIFRTVWSGAMEEESIWRLLLGEGLRGDETVIRVGQDLMDLVRPGLAGLLKEAVPEVPDPDRVASVMIGQLFHGFVLRIFNPERPLDAIADAMVDTLELIAGVPAV